MKLAVATASLALLLVSPSLAQNALPNPARPKLQAPDETAKAMAQADRLSLQSDLAWSGNYNGVINGEVSDRMVAAIKSFQKEHGGKETGVLNPQERSVLADLARKQQASVGWKIATDPVTGARVGLPSKLVPNTSSDANGSKWTSPTGTIQVSLDRRKEAGATIASVAEAEKKANARKIEYAAVKPDFFVLSGLQGLKRFYVRGQTANNEVRILTILYDQATEGTMTPITVAMSSAFNPFPSGNTASTPPRKSIEYSTGVIVSADGAILGDGPSLDGCDSIIAANYGSADKVAQDEVNDLMLLRLYGVSGLQPLAIDAASTKTAGIATGIADPQGQGGGSAASSLNVTWSNGTVEKTLSPAPPLGFSGAAVMDDDGTFAGIARVRPSSVAAASATTTGPLATLVAGSAVRDFLRDNKISAANGASNAKSAAVRLICVRK